MLRGAYRRYTSRARTLSIPPTRRVPVNGWPSQWRRMTAVAPVEVRACRPARERAVRRIAYEVGQPQPVGFQ